MSSIVTGALTLKVVTPYQKEPWTNACKGGIRSALQYMGKGCFDLSETHYDTYTKSKMFKLLNVIKFNMQDALRYLVQNSCAAYRQMMAETCSITLGLDSSFEWGSDLKKSNLVPQRSPLLYIELQLTDQGATYGTNFEDIKGRDCTCLYEKKVVRMELIRVETLVENQS